MCLSNLQPKKFGILTFHCLKHIFDIRCEYVIERITIVMSIRYVDIYANSLIFTNSAATHYREFKVFVLPSGQVCRCHLCNAESRSSQNRRSSTG